MEEHVTRPASLFYEGGETLCIRAMSTEGAAEGIFPLHIGVIF